MSKFYTGVGSRITPVDILRQFARIAFMFESAGWILRTGDAPGADQGFRDGVEKSQHVEVFTAEDSLGDVAAHRLASSIHPYWANLSPYARQLHARNCYQVLGRDLKTPSKLLICWTQGGKAVGGTRTAIKLAEYNSIPIINAGKSDLWRGLVDEFLAQ